MSGGVNEEIEQFDDELLRISKSCNISSSDQYSVSKYVLILSLGNYDLIDASLLMEEQHGDWIV